MADATEGFNIIQIFKSFAFEQWFYVENPYSSSANWIPKVQSIRALGRAMAGIIQAIGLKHKHRLQERRIAGDVPSSSVATTASPICLITPPSTFPRRFISLSLSTVKSWVQLAQLGAGRPVALVLGMGT